jgi:hypothetical protein
MQKKYWSKLKAPQKIAVMDILLSLLEFAASYNSYTNLRMRMHQNTDERYPTKFRFIYLPSPLPKNFLVIETG